MEIFQESEVVIDHESYAISFDDAKRLIDFFPYGDCRRIAFILLALTGCRPCELDRLNIKCFVGDYCIWRPGKGQSGYRKELLPTWFFDELEYYLSRTHLADGHLFPFSSTSLRRYLNKVIRPKLGGNFTKKVLRQPNGTCQFHYMIDLKSFRHTYAVKEFWDKLQKYGADVAIGLTSKKMRHGANMMTARHYVSDIEYMGNSLEKYRDKTVGDILKDTVQTRLSQWMQFEEKGQRKIKTF